jgi:hypothetical protein
VIIYHKIANLRYQSEFLLKHDETKIYDDNFELLISFPTLYIKINDIMKQRFVI